MEAELELNLDKDGRPCIKIKHHDNDDSLEQQALKIFIISAIAKGIELVPICGFLNTPSGESWENYEIQINQKEESRFAKRLKEKQNEKK
jgi:hypothetical protein